LETILDSMNIKAQERDEKIEYATHVGTKKV